MKNLHKNIGIFALSLFATSSAVYLYSPVIGSHADNSATADINLTVGEVMNLTLDTNSLDLSTTPKNFVSGVINATASTNSQYGYTLTLEDIDSNTNLVHANENIEAIVSSSFSGSKTSSEMEDNTWGFSLNTTDFYKVPVNGSPVALKRTTTPMATASETTPVTFGAKVGNLTSGAYTDSVLFTMYVNGQDGNPSDGTDPDDPGDELTGCAALDGVIDGVYTDSRDGNTYTVADMGDGHCWMTQNLRIANKTITSDDSDVTRSFTIPASGTTTTSEDGYVVQIDSEYGGYYSFHTMMANNNNQTLSSGDASASICPKGWKVPSRNEWEAMISSVESLDTRYYMDMSEGGNGIRYYTMSHLTTSPMNLNTDSGYAYSVFVYNKTNNYGSDSVPSYDESYYWTSTAPSNKNGTYVRIYQKPSNSTQYIQIGGGKGRHYGHSIRCMSR